MKYANVTDEVKKIIYHVYITNIEYLTRGEFQVMAIGRIKRDNLHIYHYNDTLLTTLLLMQTEFCVNKHFSRFESWCSTLVGNWLIAML